MDDSTALVEGVPDGMLLSEWSAQNDVGRTTTYALLKVLKAMGIPVRMVIEASTASKRKLSKI
jgi:hypothetical protein